MILRLNECLNGLSELQKEVTTQGTDTLSPAPNRDWPKASLVGSDLGVITVQAKLSD